MSKSKFHAKTSFMMSNILDNGQEQDEDCQMSDDMSDDCVTNSRISSSPGSTSPGSLRSSKKQRKARTIFSDKQLQTLEECFDKQKYLSVQERLDLARRLCLSDTQVKTWYQNRRTKWKRQSTVGYDILSEAGNFNAFQSVIRTNPMLAAYVTSQMNSTNAALAAHQASLRLLAHNGSEFVNPLFNVQPSSLFAFNPSSLCR